MRARTPWLVALALSLAALATWRVVCVVAGSDIDTDAYAHHMIARAILADPRDLSVHWVWLPLFHYAQVPLVALGGTMDHVRWANVVLAAAVPWVLFTYVRRTARAGEAQAPPEATALLAALLAGACPIVMQMGTTAQPEPLFALLVLGIAIAFERRSYAATTAILSAAVLIRYEAWAVLAAITAVLIMEAWRRRGRQGMLEMNSLASGSLVVLVPALLIVAWAALRSPIDGQWFGFLRQTRDFATQALRQESALDRGVWGLARDLAYYPIVVPVRVLGPTVGLAPFGIARTVQQQGRRFVLVLLACLGFVSLSWVMRSSLGLDRHFVAVVPLYATFAAQGASVVADWGVRVAQRFIRSERGSVLVGRGMAGSLVVVSLVGFGVQVDEWMDVWQASIARGWPDRAALGAYLRSLSGAPTIFCDDATLEITSRLDRRRFDRHWIEDPHTWYRVQEVTKEQGVAYIATWRRKLRGHEQAGAIVFRAGFDPADQEGTGVAIMRMVPGPAPTPP
jgi:hypothetical protein